MINYLLGKWIPLDNKDNDGNANSDDDEFLDDATCQTSVSL